MENKLIVIEGCDNSGKTTLMKDLKSDIKARNKDILVQTFSLPYRGRFGYAKIREVLGGKVQFPPDVIQSLFIANFIETAEKDINPFLTDYPNNRICILDRSLISTILYNAMSGGAIFESIQTYMHKLSMAGVKEVSQDPSVLDLDIINKIYGHLAVSVDFTFFLAPPLPIVLERAAAKAAETGEENDGKAMVQRMYAAYQAFYNFISGGMYRSVMDFLENPKGILKPQQRDLDKYVILNEWNHQVSAEENHKVYREAILAKLNL